MTISIPTVTPGDQPTQPIKPLSRFRKGDRFGLRRSKALPRMGEKEEEMVQILEAHRLKDSRKGLPRFEILAATGRRYRTSAGSLASRQILDYLPRRGTIDDEAYVVYCVVSLHIDHRGRVVLIEGSNSLESWDRAVRGQIEFLGLGGMPAGAEAG